MKKPLSKRILVTRLEKRIGCFGFKGVCKNPAEIRIITESGETKFFCEKCFKKLKLKENREIFPDETELKLKSRSVVNGITPGFQTWRDFSKKNSDKDPESLITRSLDKIHANLLVELFSEGKIESIDYWGAKTEEFQLDNGDRIEIKNDLPAVWKNRNGSIKKVFYSGNMQLSEFQEWLYNLPKNFSLIQGRFNFEGYRKFIFRFIGSGESFSFYYKNGEITESNLPSGIDGDLIRWMINNGKFSKGEN